MTNQTLSIFDLRDIMVPEPVGFWPPAPFVWVLLGVVGLGLAILAWRGYTRWKAGAYRRAGLVCLAQIEKQFVITGSEIVALHELSVLLKRVAIAAFPRKQVAPLYGENWLRFLDSTCKGCMFISGSGRLLAVGMAAVPKVSLSNVDESKHLVSLARTWIKSHRPPKSITGTFDYPKETIEKGRRNNMKLLI